MSWQTRQNNLQNNWLPYMSVQKKILTCEILIVFWNSVLTHNKKFFVVNRRVSPKKSDALSETQHSWANW